jgi:hypothetical protein
MSKKGCIGYIRNILSRANPNDINFDKLLYWSLFMGKLETTATADALSMAVGILRNYLPPTKSWTDKTDSYPSYHHSTNTEPGSTSSPLHKLFRLSFGDRKPRQDASFLAVLFPKCSFTTLCFTHNQQSKFNQVLRYLHQD